MKKAVIACQVLYSEIMELANNRDIDVELLPQGLHNYVDSEKMKAEIQAKIDDLEAKKDYDYIILAYGYCSGGVEGLKAKNAGLVIGLVHDCIPLLSGKIDPKGSIDDGATYYLSRGWIDCGGDSYKEFLFLTDQMDHWLEKFAKYQKENSEVAVLWPEKDQYQISQRKYTLEVAEYITFELLKNYHSITLIDNGNLYPIHREYAQEMHGFINDLLKRQQGKGLSLQIKKGNDDLLRKLLFFDELDSSIQQKLFLITPAGGQLNLKKLLLQC